MYSTPPTTTTGLRTFRPSWKLNQDLRLSYRRKQNLQPIQHPARLLEKNIASAKN